MRTINSIAKEVYQKIHVDGTHARRRWRNTAPALPADRKKAINCFANIGTLTIDFATETWTVGSYSFDYKDVYVVFCTNYAQCEQFENTNGKFTALICVDLETKKVYCLTRDNNSVVRLIRLYKPPFPMLTNMYKYAIYSHEALEDGVHAYDYTS